jgi:hypothetical protein
VYAPKVGCLQTGRTGLVDVESNLEVSVEGIQKTVAETPEKEEDGDESKRVERFTSGELSGLGAARIVGLERALLEKLLERHGGGTTRVMPDKAGYVLE